MVSSSSTEVTISSSLRIPPLVGDDAVPVAVGAGEERGVTGSSAGIGVVVIAIGEVGAAVKKEPESAIAKLVAITFEIVATELVNDNDDDQFGPAIVG